MPFRLAQVIIPLVVLLWLATGCAVKTGQGKVESSPSSRLILDSLPGDAEGLFSADLTPGLQRGWDELRAAGFSRAAAIFTAELDSTALAGTGRSAALCGLGFARLGLSSRREAEQAFEEALAAEPDYSPGLLGLAVLRRLQGRTDEIVESYDLLAARHPHSAMLKLEATAARLEAVQLLVRRGEAAQADNPGAAVQFFSQAISLNPDLPQLYGLLAGVLDSSGRQDEALKALEQALSLAEGEEANTYRKRLAWLELEYGKPEVAVALFERLLQDSPRSPALEDGLARAEEKLHEASIPVEYRNVLQGDLPLDRGGLAAIIVLEGGWGEGPLSQSGTSRVIRDAGSHWAQPYIQTVVDCGAMDLYQNHTFRPSDKVSRGDLAVVACRLLHGREEYLSDVKTVVISDLSRDHRHYGCINRLVSLGLLKRFPDNTVRINTPASGADALELMSMIRRLGHPPNP